jgi:5'-nucleotidase
MPHTAKLHPGLLDLLQLADNGGVVDRTRAVYVNRSLRMQGIEVIGFDMDYSLALYKMEAIERLAMEKTLDKLEARGYPPALREAAYDRDFVMRGLVVDKRHGNLFKMDRHRHVVRAHHGFRRLTKAERKRIYRSESIRPSAPRYHTIDTLFALPEAFLFAGLIDHFERNGGMEVSFKRLFDDIRSSIDEAHRDDSLKSVVLADLDTYVMKDPDLALTLHKFRSAGKRLFLLTNSLFPYSDAVMSHLFDGVLPEYPSWRNFFDLVLVGATKPDFFAEGRPFLELDEDGEPIREVTGLLQRGRIYQGGNLHDLQRSLRVAPDRVLYVGDHIYGDVLRSKKASAWRTAMIIQEMERELEVEALLQDRLNEVVRLEDERSTLEERVDFDQSLLRALQRILEPGIEGFAAEEQNAIEATHQRIKDTLDRHRRALRTNHEAWNALGRTVERTFNDAWGPLFKAGVEHSAFGGQVEDYACVYTSRVSNFLSYSPARYFRAPRDRMPHERH